MSKHFVHNITIANNHNELTTCTTFFYCMWPDNNVGPTLPNIVGDRLLDTTTTASTAHTTSSTMDNMDVDMDIDFAEDPEIARMQAAAEQMQAVRYRTDRRTEWRTNNM